MLPSRVPQLLPRHRPPHLLRHLRVLRQMGLARRHLRVLLAHQLRVPLARQLWVLLAH